ncbi:MAG: ABC transporter ATP-binding protein [Anaerolineaceae bacterium]|nr:ABC transporter ATP-binding protein [Anaerolineaceae bacterium]
MSNPLVIEAQALRKSYGQLQALRGVDLEVHPGEVFGFLGPNGAGKTTTIRCLLDLIRPNGGALRVLGLDPQRHPVDVRARCGYLPGELHFEDAQTVEGALRYLGELRPKKLDWDFVRQLASRLDLDLKPQIKNLSKGNKQKVGIVQAFMARPELLLLDEPTSGLDPLAQRAVLGLVGEARQHGATVFFSSHVLSEVQEIAERVAILRQGSVVEVADPQALIRRALRRVTVRFGRPVSPSSLAPLVTLPGVKLLSAIDATPLRLQVEGEIDSLVKSLAAFSVSDLETERPSLEELFLAYYESPAGQGG